MEDEVSAPAPAATNGKAEEATSNGDDSAGEVVGSTALRPIFFGNLIPNYISEEVTKLFEEPGKTPKLEAFEPVPVDRIDMKRGYCFVFLKDAESQGDKGRIEDFVKEINGIEVPGLSRAIRAEFARGDGRVKRKEDQRRQNIAPSETLFVVNFPEETTKREDLQMLFEPFGELVRIDLKRNYAFVQFKTIAEATKAKDSTNGGKLDQSVLTVEYVARQRDNDGGGRNRRDGGRGREGGRDRFDDRRRYDDRRGGGRFDMDHRDRGGGYDYDRRGGGRGGGRRDSPPPYRGGGRRSRSRSPPPRYRSRSPPPRDRGSRYNDRYDDRRRRGSSPRDDYRGTGRGGAPSPPRRGASPEFYRGGDRDRGYRG